MEDKDKLRHAAADDGPEDAASHAQPAASNVPSEPSADLKKLVAQAEDLLQAVRDPAAKSPESAAQTLREAARERLVNPPPFQRLSKDDAVKVTRPYALKTWVGDKERILAVQKLLEDALETAYGAVVAELNKSAAEPDTTGLRTYRIERMADDYRLNVEVTGRGGRWTREGELSAIFDDVELDDIESIEMSNREIGGSADVEVRVSFSRSGESYRTPKGVDVKISGNDKAWVTSLHDTVVERLSRGKPVWSFATTSWFPPLIAVVFYAGGITAFYTLLPDNPDNGVVSLGALLLLIGSAAVGIGLTWPIGKLLPAFEVTQPGAAGQGARTVGVFVGLTAFVLSAIVFPIVLALVMGS